MLDDMPEVLAHLPLFASDDEIAVAIVGKKRAAQWRKERLPTIATLPGFPGVDPVHQGRSVARVWLFYKQYLGISEGVVGSGRELERPDLWKPGRKKRTGRDG